MNTFILISILGVLVGILYCLRKMVSLNRDKDEGNVSLDKMVGIMEEARADRMREDTEREMREYLEKRKKAILVPLPMTSNERMDRPVNTRARELVPFNLSPTEKALWEAFNR